MVRNQVRSATSGVISYFTRHKTAANLILVLILAIGIAVVPRMRTQFFPDVIVENVSVSVTWSGAGPEDVDRAIVQSMEPSLLTVEGVESSTANSTEGRASITLSFEPGWDMARAADDVQSAVDAVTNLPQDAEEPEVRRGIWRDRVTDVVITGPIGVDQLGRFADEFVTRLFAVGVTRTTIRGVAAPETLVEIPSVELIRHDISLAEIAEVIRGEVSTDPAGGVSGGASRVRTGVEKRSPDQVAAIVIASRPDGTNLTVGDVATVIVGGVDRERAYFVGENPAISVRVDRSNQGDAIEIQSQVEDIAAEMEATLPEGVRIDLIRTRSEAITGRLDILVDNGLIGLGLVVLLLFLFLNARTAFWVAAGIPVAMLGAIALMYAFGLTINMISLFALIITLGIVVDDAIVVGEHADYRARTLGEDPATAAERAAQRMSAPVFSASITTIIAFFGLVAVGGRFGDLIRDIPFTVIVVLIASLIECFLILPNHMAHALKAQAKVHWYDIPSRVVTRGFFWFRRTLFRPFIAGVIWLRYPICAAALVLLATQAAVFIRGDVTWRFFNAPERGSISGNFAMLPGAGRDESREMMRELQRATDAVAARYEEEYGRNPLDYVVAEIGGTTGRGLAGSDTKDRDQLGSIAIELIDADERPYSSFRFLGDLQDEVQNHPMLETVSFRGWRSGPGGDALDVKFFGASAEVLKSASEELKTTLSSMPEVSALEDTLTYDKEELILDLTPQGQVLGITIDTLGRVLRNRLNGIEAATYPDGPRSATIRVELPTAELTADFLEKTFIRTATGTYVPLADIVTVQSRTGFSTVRRENGIRLVTVTGDIAEDNPERATEITTQLRDEILPRIEQQFGISSEMSGLAEQERDFLEDALLGFSLCLIGIYLTLVWVFSSWSRPIVIVIIIPFGLVGTIYGHHAWDVPLSMFTVIGLIGMTGIIINDSIVLVSTVDEYAKDRGLIPAIIDGTSDRLRPVLLTTLTTVLGLAPLLFETSRHAQFLKPTVITLCYGLGFGMVLVLFVVPSLMAMQADLSRQVTGFKRAVSGQHGAIGLRAVFATLSLVVAAIFSGTLGATLWTGAMPQILAPILPAGLDPSAISSAFVVFISAVTAILSLTWIGAIFLRGLGRRQV
ncbi:MAG: efflux RND transporter permease subunit [Pseudomonadota bacterium]